MSNVIKNKNDICVFDWKMVEELKNIAEKSELRRARYCMHRSDSDLVQEMVIVLCQDSDVPIHFHDGNKSESFHIIEGMLTVLLYNEEQQLLREVPLGDIQSGRSSLYRLCTPLWHSVRIETKFVVFHEIVTGPFIN